jgi:hypothetical protein
VPLGVKASSAVNAQSRLGLLDRIHDAAMDARRQYHQPASFQIEGGCNLMTELVGDDTLCVPFLYGIETRTDSQVLFVTGAFVLTDFKPVRVCEPERSADSALPRSGNRQAPHK